jgi:hypothetical protein
MRLLIGLLLFLFPLLASSQYKIIGKVLDSADKKPIPGATVFLANASVGTASNTEGVFTLDNVHGGQYELVVTMVGYKPYRQTILINSDLTLKDIVISAKSIALGEVKVRPDPNWAKNYAVFKSEFLGNSDYARQCKILNPDMVNLHFDRDSLILTGSSSDFIIIENQALGYRIKYLLSDFRKDFKQKYLTFSGTAYFEELTGDAKKQETWKKNRLQAYNGSSMHFLRSSLADQLPANGFVVRRMTMKSNPDYKEGGAEPKYRFMVMPLLLRLPEFVKPTTEKALHALMFDDCLYITHSKKPVQDTILDNEALPTSIIFNKPYAAFDNNGIFTDPSAITFDGEWGKNRMAEMLPVDYEPVK